MREEILNAAVGVLNENGINSTTFRQIAAKLAISDGHVRYYFKTKEVLLLAIFEKLNEEILELAQMDKLPQGDIKEDLRSKIQEVFFIMAKYSFIFHESPQTIKQYPAFADFYQHLLKERKAVFIQTFEAFIQLGFFSKNFDKAAQEQVYHAFFILSDSWIRHHFLQFSQAPDSESIRYYADLSFGLLKPYFKVSEE